MRVITIFFWLDIILDRMRFFFFLLLQGSASAIKGDFLLSSDHLIEIITKLHRTGATAANREELNIDISDEYDRTKQVIFFLLLADASRAPSCVAGSWFSSSRTKCAWNSSREPPRMATACPASARIIACWRCWCPQWRSAPLLPAHQCFFSRGSDWHGVDVKAASHT